jgi:DNA polymerase-3 subunit delta'
MGLLQPTDIREEQGAELFQSPQTQPFCAGHDEIEQYFLDAYNKNALPHSLIFTGPEGIGKATFAFRLARFLFKHGISDTDQGGLFAADPLPPPESMDLSPTDSVFTQIASGAYPDLLYVEREYDAKKNKRNDAVRVNDIREINKFMRKTSSYGGWRIVIIDDADTMNRNAQNAVLKILEEPPKNSMIIMIAHRMGTFLPTIRSRVNVVNFSPLADNTIRELLEKSGADNINDAVLKFSGGRLSQALQFQNENFQDIYESIEAIYSGRNKTIADFHKTADTIGRAGNNDNFSMFETVLLSLLETDIQQAARDNKSNEKLLDTYDDARTLIMHTKQSNLDKKQCVLQICMLLSRV